jgi:hypothetical protein
VFEKASAESILNFVIDNLPDQGIIEEEEGNKTTAPFLHADTKAYVKELVLPSGKAFLDNITNTPESKSGFERFIKSGFMYKKIHRACKDRGMDLSNADGTMLSLPLFIKDTGSGKVIVSSRTGILLNHYIMAIMLETSMPQVAKAIVVNSKFADVVLYLLKTREEGHKTTLKDELQKALKEIDKNPYQRELYNNPNFTLD